MKLTINDKYELEEGKNIIISKSDKYCSSKISKIIDENSFVDKKSKEIFQIIDIVGFLHKDGLIRNKKWRNYRERPELSLKINENFKLKEGNFVIITINDHTIGVDNIFEISDDEKSFLTGNNNRYYIEDINVEKTKMLYEEKNVDWTKEKDWSFLGL